MVKQLGSGDHSPYLNKITKFNGIQISGNHIHTCALLDNSTISCWGYGNEGTEMGLEKAQEFL